MPASPARIERSVPGLCAHVTRPTISATPLQLLLLLRSSGDERADRIRRRRMQSCTERMAATAGWRPEDPDADHLLIRAQMALALGFGIVVMRTSAELRPLASATAVELDDPLRAALEALLSPV